MLQFLHKGASDIPTPPAPGDSMSLQLAIPWLVALQQSQPPLHQLALLCNLSAALCNQEFAAITRTTLTRGLTLGAHPSQVIGNRLNGFPSESAASHRAEARYE